MGWDYINHPKFFSGMQSPRYYFENPVLLRDVVALLAPERTGLPLLDSEGDPELCRKVENELHQWVSHQGRRAIAAGAFVNFVQLRFLPDNCLIIKNGIKARTFEGEMHAGSSLSTGYCVSRSSVLWSAHKATEPALMRDLVSNFHEAMKETFTHVLIKDQVTVWLRHPAVKGSIEVDIDGNRLDKGGLTPSGEGRWMPWGYDKPVQLSRRLLQNHQKWQRRLAELSPETCAKLFALAR